MGVGLMFFLLCFSSKRFQLVNGHSRHQKLFSFFSSCFLMLRPMWFVLINDRSEEEEYVRCSKHSVASSTFVQPYSCSWIVSNSKRP